MVLFLVCKFILFSYVNSIPWALYNLYIKLKYIQFISKFAINQLFYLLSSDQWKKQQSLLKFTSAFDFTSPSQWNILFYFLCFYCCSSTVVSIFPPPLSLAPPTATSYPPSFLSSALSMGPFYMFLVNPFHSFPPTLTSAF